MKQKLTETVLSDETYSLEERLEYAIWRIESLNSKIKILEDKLAEEKSNANWKIHNQAGCF